MYASPLLPSDWHVIDYPTRTDNFNSNSIKGRHHSHLLKEMPVVTVSDRIQRIEDRLGLAETRVQEHNDSMHAINVAIKTKLDAITSIQSIQAEKLSALANIQKRVIDDMTSNLNAKLNQMHSTQMEALSALNASVEQNSSRISQILNHLEISNT